MVVVTSHRLATKATKKRKDADDGSLSQSQSSSCSKKAKCSVSPSNDSGSSSDEDSCSPSTGTTISQTQTTIVSPASVAVAARRKPQITMKQPKWIDCPEPYTDEKDARYTWVQYLKPTLGVLVTQSISRPESNYSYESILLIRHLCHQYNEKEDRLVEFMQSSIGIWKLAKHKKKVGGIDFELEKWDVVEKWIEHMRAVMLTLNYDLKKWQSRKDSLVYQFRGTRNYIPVTWSRLEITTLATFVLRHIFEQALGVDMGKKQFESEFLHFSHDVLISFAKNRRQSIVFTRLMISCFDNMGLPSREHDNIIVSCWHNRKLDGAKRFGELVHSECKALANTQLEYEKMSTSFLELAKETSRRKNGSTFTKQAIRARLLKDDPPMARFIAQASGKGRENLPDTVLAEIERLKASLERRVRGLWWNFLCTKGYIMYMNEGDTQHTTTDIRTIVRSLVDSGKHLLPDSRKQLPTPVKEAEESQDEDEEEEEEEEEDVDADNGGDGNEVAEDGQDGEEEEKEEDEEGGNGSDGERKRGDDGEETKEEHLLKVPRYEEQWKTPLYFFREYKRRVLRIRSPTILGEDDQEKFDLDALEEWQSLPKKKKDEFVHQAEDHRRRWLSARMLPPRPEGFKTAYFFFQDEKKKRLEILAPLLQHSNFRFSEETTADWAALSPKEKRKYITRSDEDRRRCLQKDREWFALSKIVDERIRRWEEEGMPEDEGTQDTIARDDGSALAEEEMSRGTHDDLPESKERLGSEDKLEGCTQGTEELIREALEGKNKETLRPPRARVTIRDDEPKVTIREKVKQTISQTVVTTVATSFFRAAKPRARDVVLPLVARKLDLRAEEKLVSSSSTNLSEQLTADNRTSDSVAPNPAVESTSDSVTPNPAVESTREESSGEGVGGREEEVIVEKVLAPQAEKGDLLQSDEEDEVIVEKVVPPPKCDSDASDEDSGDEDHKEEKESDCEPITPALTEETDGLTPTANENQTCCIKELPNKRARFRLCKTEDLAHQVFDFVLRSEEPGLVMMVENHPFHVWSTRKEHEMVAGFRMKSDGNEFPRKASGVYPEINYMRGVKQFNSLEGIVNGSRLAEGSLVLERTDLMKEICFCLDGWLYLSLRLDLIMSSLIFKPGKGLGVYKEYRSQNKGGGTCRWWLHRIGYGSFGESKEFLSQLAKIARFMWGCLLHQRSINETAIKEWETGMAGERLRGLLGISPDERMGFSKGAVEVFEADGVFEYDFTQELKEKFPFQYTVRLGLPVRSKSDSTFYQVIFNFECGRLSQKRGTMPYKVEPPPQK